MTCHIDPNVGIAETVLTGAVRALTVLTVSDHVLTDESLDPAARERSFPSMIEVASGAASGKD